MNYNVKALIVMLILMTVTIVINQMTTGLINALHIGLLLLFMFGTSVLIHVLTRKAISENATRFPSYFMGITGLKMFVYIIMIGVYVFIFKKAAIPVVITFMIAYIIYTVLEVFSALQELKKQE